MCKPKLLRMKPKHCYSALAGIVSVFAASAYAGEVITQTTVTESPSGIVGHLGLSAGYNFAYEGGDDEAASVSFGTIDGSITLPVFGQYLVVADAYWRTDDFESDDDFDADEDPESEYSLGVHFLRQITDNTRVGIFGGNGDSSTQGDPSSDSYDVWMYGIEAHHFLADNIMIFAQLGFADKGRDGEDDSEGFNNGLLGRFGVSYFPNNKSAITLEFEAAGTNNYIDSDDSGRFFGTTLSYQRLVMDGMPLYFTCFGRYDVYSTTDSNSVDEFSVGVGLRYYFGAGSPQEAAHKGLSIGSPRLPTRGSAWTEFLD